MGEILTTEYISGFADADGCFSGHAILLSNTDRDLLVAIQKSLSTMGISSSIVPYSMASKKSFHTPAYTLRIYGFKNLILFAAHVGFKLERKQGALSQYLKPMCKKGCLYCIEDHNLVISLKNQKMSWRKIGKRVGIPWTTIYNRFHRNEWPLEQKIINVIHRLGLFSSSAPRSYPKMSKGNEGNT